MKLLTMRFRDNQGGDLLVLRQQQVGVLGEVTGSLAGERPLVVLHRPGSQQRRGVHLHRSKTDN
ncbi:hypothetical protein EYF80_024760 [Liparis tanakae]|uniref:Uncharacterized protein n=1 Tax=Liparis tanakae TaxID=230148 RepID=A0A4Z2HHD2_9TELE|nr:hypothetical protein EYF80_024760 [Liparis tanakae]